MRKRTTNQKSNQIIKKIKRYLYYEKKLTPKLDIKNTQAINIFFKDQGIECNTNKKKFLIELYESKTNEVLIRRSIRRPRKRNGRNQYLNYLQSQEWQEVRERVFKQRGRKCERCNEDLRGKKADVHHKHYRNLFNEKLEDLEVLCRPCHNLEHKDKRKKSNIKKTLTNL